MTGSLPPLSSPGIPALGKTALLVEDHAEFRAFLLLWLERLGFCVLEAGEGEEALRLAGEYPHLIHLLVSDVELPGITGPETAKQLLSSRPALNILYMSGRPYSCLVEEGVVLPGRPFLQKPFTYDHFQRQVNRSLNDIGDTTSRSESRHTPTEAAPPPEFLNPGRGVAYHVPLTDPEGEPEIIW